MTQWRLLSQPAFLHEREGILAGRTFRVGNGEAGQFRISSWRTGGDIVLDREALYKKGRNVNSAPCADAQDIP